VNPPEVKICGLTRVEDALQALESGADYLGFVLYPPSPRSISPSALKRLRLRLPESARCVGVFVNMAPVEVAGIVRECGLFAAQLSGDEAARDFSRPDFRIWRTVRRIGGRWSPDPGDWCVERFLVDSAGPQYGGAGRVSDWSRAGVLARACPVLLAGGLTPENVAEAVQTVRPVGVDVASGVESEPGRKDWARLQRFIRSARSAYSEECGPDVLRLDDGPPGRENQEARP
jgi:phosphoribosylanthranilate isomerase